MRPRAVLSLLAVVAVLGACGGGAPAGDPPAQGGDVLESGGLALRARFAVRDGELGPVLGGDAEDIATGRELWAALERLAPADVRRRLSGFAVYAPTDDTNAFTREDERGDGWLVGVSPTPPGRLLDTVLLHELAHVVTLGPDEVERGDGPCATYETSFGCARPASCIARFVTTFWDPARGGADPAATPVERLAAARGAFLGPHAATMPEEDLATVWAAAATGHPLPTPLLRAKAAFVESCPTLAALGRGGSAS